MTRTPYTFHGTVVNRARHVPLATVHMQQDDAADDARSGESESTLQRHSHTCTRSTLMYTFLVMLGFRTRRGQRGTHRGRCQRVLHYMCVNIHTVDDTQTHTTSTPRSRLCFNTTCGLHLCMLHLPLLDMHRSPDFISGGPMQRLLCMT